MFLCADVKASVCDRCRKPRFCLCGCQQLVLTPGRYWASGHNPATNTVEAHQKQAAKICGENNPAKRPEVRAAISFSVSANHPSFWHKELWASLARSMKPTKTSRLEDEMEAVLLGFDRQVIIGYYTLDFANEDLQEAVEINGCWHHVCPRCEIEVTSDIQRNTLRNDHAKASYLRNHGWDLTTIWGCEVPSYVNVHHQAA